MSPLLGTALKVVSAMGIIATGTGSYYCLAKGLPNALSFFKPFQLGSHLVNKIEEKQESLGKIVNRVRPS